MILIFWYFVLGIIFISIIFPILNGISEIILTWFELLKGKMNVKMTADQVASEKQAFDFKLECAKKEEEFGADEEKTFSIGFCADDIPEEDEVIEDDE